MTEEILEQFESESVTFTVYGLQMEGKGAAPKVSYNELKRKFLFWNYFKNSTKNFKMSTRELKEKQGVSSQQADIATNAQWGSKNSSFRLILGLSCGN